MAKVFGLYICDPYGVGATCHCLHSLWQSFGDKACLVSTSPHRLFASSPLRSIAVIFFTAMCRHVIRKVSQCFLYFISLRNSAYHFVFHCGYTLFKNLRQSARSAGHFFSLRSLRPSFASIAVNLLKNLRQSARSAGNTNLTPVTAAAARHDCWFALPAYVLFARVLALPRCWQVAPGSV